jgi:hypothetical protein
MVVIEWHDFLGGRVSSASPEIIKRLEVLGLHLISEFGLTDRLWVIWVGSAIHRIYLEIDQVSIVHLDVMIAYPWYLRFS